MSLLSRSVSSLSDTPGAPEVLDRSGLVRRLNVGIESGCDVAEAVGNVGGEGAHAGHSTKRDHGGNQGVFDQVLPVFLEKTVFQLREQGVESVGHRVNCLRSME